VTGQTALDLSKSRVKFIAPPDTSAQTPAGSVTMLIPRGEVAAAVPTIGR